MASVRARVPPPPSSHDAHGCLAAAERALASNSAAGQSLAALSGASSVTSAAGTLPLCNVAVRQEAAAHAMGTQYRNPANQKLAEFLQPSHPFDSLISGSALLDAV